MWFVLELEFTLVAVTCFLGECGTAGPYYKTQNHSLKYVLKYVRVNLNI